LGIRLVGEQALLFELFRFALHGAADGSSGHDLGSLEIKMARRAESKQLSAQRACLTIAHGTPADELFTCGKIR